MAGPTRVLLVDDDPSLADLMANQLGTLEESFSIRIETDPNDALDAIETGRIDCVVSDHHMPQMTGLSCSGTSARWIRISRLSVHRPRERGNRERRRLGGRHRLLPETPGLRSVAGSRKQDRERRREVPCGGGGPAPRVGASPTGSHRYRQRLHPRESLCELGRETLEVEYGALLTDTDDGIEILVESVGAELPFETGDRVPLSDDIGDLTVDGNSIVAVAGNAGTSAETGFSSYIGTPVYVGERRFGTLCFCDRGDRTEFTALGTRVRRTARRLAGPRTDERMGSGSKRVGGVGPRAHRARTGVARFGRHRRGSPGTHGRTGVTRSALPEDDRGVDRALVSFRQ